MNKDILEFAEMTQEQLEFLCGLIEREKPKKVVEIGVAAGGTSVVLIDKLESMKYDTIMYSIDVSEKYYRDTNKKTGYLIEQYKETHTLQMNHESLIGGYAVEFLEQIGRDIDFLILDTMHSLPGEILDFLACYPFLAKNAIVVVHDVILNHLSNNSEAYATNVLLSSVVGDKLTPISVERDYPGIGAFRINNDTGKYLEDVFNALMITWEYMPKDTEINMYLEWYRKFYKEKDIYIFDQAIKWNKTTLIKKRKNRINQYGIINKFIELFYKKEVYIYGKGYYGCIFEDLLKSSNVDVKGFVVSDGQLANDGIMCFSDFVDSKLCENENSVLLIGLSKEIQQEVVPIIKSSGIKNYIIPSEEILRILSV